MNEISLPYHLILPALISIWFLGFLVIRRRRIYSKRKWVFISSILFFSIYLFIVGGATFEDIYAKWNLNQYDLNKDGLFSGNELTADMREAMRRLTNDIGRNFSFLTGLIFSGAISMFVLISGLFLEFINLSKRH